MTDEQTSNPESLVTSGPRGLTARSQGLVARGLDLLAKRVRAVERPADQSQDGRSVPNDPWSWFIRRNAYWWFENGYNAYWAKDWARAVYAYGEALRLEPDYVLACVGRGLVHRSEGQYAQAILNFQEALRLEPYAVVAWDALGEAYLRQGSTSQATEVYERLKILDPVRADSFLRNILHPDPEPPPISVGRSEGQGMAMVQEEFESEADDEMMGLRRRDDPRQQLLPTFEDEDRRAIGRYRSQLESRDEDDRRSAIVGLTGIGAARYGTVAEILIAALEDESGYVRVLAAEALSRERINPELVVPILIEALESPFDPASRTGPYVGDWKSIIAGAVGNYEADAVSAVPALTKALEDSDWNVRGSAARSLEQVGHVGRVAIPSLKAALSIEKIEQVKMMMLEALGKIQNAPEAPRRKPLLNPNQPAHPAMLLLANLDGSAKLALEEYQTVADLVYGDILDLDHGSLLPVWWPTVADEGPFELMTYEDRMVTFREGLENLISLEVYGLDIIKRSRPFLSVTPTEEIATPEIVLECLRQLRSVFRPDLR